MQNTATLTSTYITNHHPLTVTHQPDNRQRNVIWFNPPYSKNVKTNIARDFLRLLDKHFPQTHKLYNIFNRHTVRISFLLRGSPIFISPMVSFGLPRHFYLLLYYCLALLFYSIYLFFSLFAFCGKK